MASSEMKRGDWLCPDCDAHNFASKVACFKCGVPKPGTAKKKAAPKPKKKKKAKAKSAKKKQGRRVATKQAPASGNAAAVAVLEKSIRKSPKNANGILRLLKFLRDEDDRDTQLAALHALRRVFISAAKRGDLSRQPAAKRARAEEEEEEGKPRDAMAQFREWMRGRYLKLLDTLLWCLGTEGGSDRVRSLRAAALRSLMEFVKVEGDIQGEEARAGRAAAVRLCSAPSPAALRWCLLPRDGRSFDAGPPTARRPLARARPRTTSATARTSASCAPWCRPGRPWTLSCSRCCRRSS